MRRFVVSDKLYKQSKVSNKLCQQKVSIFTCKKYFDVSDKGYTQRPSAWR